MVYSYQKRYLKLPKAFISIERPYADFEIFAIVTETIRGTLDTRGRTLEF